MKLCVGDLVAVLDEDLKGTIIKIVGNTITIETDEGFEFSFSENELIKEELDATLRTNVFSKSSISEVVSQKEIPKKKSKKVKPKERSLPTLEIDLHLDHLKNSRKGMTNHEMLTLQINTAKRHLEFAIQKRIQKIVFIHGVGEGVLKIELEYLFKRYDNLKYYDADFNKYGEGATEIYIYQNTTNSD